MEKEISRALRPFQKKLAAEAALRAVCVSGLFALPVWLALALARRCFGGAVGRPAALMLPVWALLAAAGIGLVTAIISAWIPAKRAVRVSPVEAIRQTKDVKLRGREVRTSRLTEKLFGFSGMLAAKNFKRNRKRYRSTVVGLFLSVTLFISASSFCAYLTDAVDQLGGDSTLGVQLYYSEALPEGVTPEQRLGQLAAADGVESGFYTADSYANLETELAESVELLSRETLYKAAALEQVTHLTDAVQNLKAA